MKRRHNTEGKIACLTFMLLSGYTKDRTLDHYLYKIVIKEQITGVLLWTIMLEKAINGLVLHGS